MEMDVNHGSEYQYETACEIESFERNNITLNTFIDYTVLPRSSGLYWEGGGVPD
jgi:hypothetical protein